MYNRIIMSRFGGLGDMVMLTPLLRGIKELYPEITLTVVGNNNAKELMDACPFVDEYFTYDKSLKDTLFLIRKLWKSDAVYLMDTLYRISTVYAMARIKIRVGLPHKRKKFLTRCLSVEPWMNYAYEPVVYAYFLKQGLGIDITKLPSWDKLYFPKASEDEQDRVKLLLGDFLDRGYIVCSLNTGGYAKDWPLPYWADLFLKLNKLRCRIVIIGAENRTSRNIVFPDNVLDLRGKTNLLETGFIIEKADLLINGCSFPVHVANAMDTPVIGLYGSQPDYRGRPQRIYASLCSSKECAPCDTLFNSPGWCTHPTCMESITSDMVFDTVKKFYQDGKPLGEYILFKGRED